MARLPELALNRVYKTIEKSSTLSIRLNRVKGGVGRRGIRTGEGLKGGKNKFLEYSTITDLIRQTGTVHQLYQHLLQGDFSASAKETLGPIGSAVLKIQTQIYFLILQLLILPKVICFNYLLYSMKKTIKSSNICQVS